MEYKIITNLLNNTPNQSTKFRTKICVEINDESYGVYNTDIQIKDKNLMLRPSLGDYSDAYILVSGATTVAQEASGGGNDNIEVVFKNCAPLTDCISEINNAPIDNAKNIDIVMSMSNLIEYSNNYSDTSENS